jgi:hypothetical protein
MSFCNVSGSAEGEEHAFWYEKSGVEGFSGHGDGAEVSEVIDSRDNR